MKRLELDGDLLLVLEQLLVVLALVVGTAALVGAAVFNAPDFTTSKKPVDGYTILG